MARRIFAAGRRSKALWPTASRIGWQRTRRGPWSLLPALLEKQVVVCDEVGCGVVPVDPAAPGSCGRQAGRLCCQLAKRAQTSGAAVLRHPHRDQGVSLMEVILCRHGTTARQPGEAAIIGITGPASVPRGGGSWPAAWHPRHAAGGAPSTAARCAGRWPPDGASALPQGPGGAGARPAGDATSAPLRAKEPRWSWARTPSTRQWLGWRAADGPTCPVGESIAQFARPGVPGL